MVSIPFLASYSAIGGAVQMVKAGGLTIATPRNDPVIVSTIQLDGDVVSCIYRDKLAQAVAAGTDANELAARHQTALNSCIQNMIGLEHRFAEYSHATAAAVSFTVWASSIPLHGMSPSSLPILPLVHVAVRFLRPMAMRAFACLARWQLGHAMRAASSPRHA